MRMYRLVIILVVGLLLLGCNKEVRKNYYPDGSVHQVIEYKGDLMHGEFKSYYNSGELEIEGTYREGKQDGVFKWYYKNGQIEAKSFFKEGKQINKSQGYYKNGNLKIEENYERGKLNGPVKYYSPKGKIISETEYKDGLADGDYRGYHDNGQISMYAKYKNDTVIYYEEYDKEGNLIEEFRRISIDPLKDSIKVGERFKAKISIPGPIENRDVKIVPFVFGGVDKKSGMFKNKKEIIYTSLPTKKAGEYLFHVNVFIDTFSYNNRLYVKVYEDNGDE